MPFRLCPFVRKPADRSDGGTAAHQQCKVKGRTRCAAAALAACCIAAWYDLRVHGAEATLDDQTKTTAGGGGGSWRVGPPMPTPQAWAGAWSHAGILYVLSGGHKMKVRITAGTKGISLCSGMWLL
eukprot:COSAG01_NODE_8114_length_2915_cov_11.112216_2_plen_126_part_00